MKETASANLPTKYGNFIIKAWPEKLGFEPVALMTQKINTSKPVLVRVHSECLTGDTFGSYKCDCGVQKEEALKLISKSSTGGVFIYLKQEGRGIGLYEKIKTYHLQEQGYDTHEANIMLGHKPDLREYKWVKKILDDLGIKKIKLITNNPSKISEISNLGVDVAERIPLVMKSNEYNRKYFESKKAKFKHFFGKDISNYFFGISGVTNSTEVESIGDFMKGRKRDPLLKICLGIALNRKLLSNENLIKNIEKTFKAAEYYEGFVPILHYSFRYSKNPLDDLLLIRKSMPFVQYIQLNDLSSSFLKVLNYATKYFLVDFPLSNNNFNLVDNSKFIDLTIKNKVFVLLDNSGGKGKKEKADVYLSKIGKCLQKGINDIALAGGFGPDNLRAYLEAKDYFKINFSIDAETGLKTNRKLDMKKVKKYLTKLLINKG
ncbi:MAG: GTP cyclohydrolase II [Parcubacteria group bacterium]|jgi:GTP cyclohydrolase II